MNGWMDDFSFYVILFTDTSILNKNLRDGIICLKFDNGQAY